MKRASNVIRKVMLIIILYTLIVYGFIGEALSAVSIRTERICTLCHNMDVIREFDKTPQEWQVVLRQMRNFGAPIEEGEFAKIASELAREFPFELSAMETNRIFYPAGYSFPSVHPFKLYIPNEADDSVSVIDALSNRVTAVIPFFRSPHTSTVTDDGTIALITNSTLSSNFLALVDTVSNRIIGEIKVGKMPKHVELSRDDKFAYVANQVDNSISIVDIERRKEVSNIPVGKGPHIAKIDRNEKFIWVTNEFENTVSIIDLKKKKATATIEVGLAPMGLAFSMDSKYAFVSNTASATVSVIDVKKRKVVKNIDIGTRPNQIEVSKFTKKAYVAVAGAGSIAVIDPVSLEVMDRIDLGGEKGAHGIVMNPTGRFAYVTNQSSHSVSLLKLEYKGGGQVISIIPVGRFPSCI